MVEFKYHGRIGNNLFQYVMARQIAEKNGLQLATSWRFQNILPMSKIKTGDRVTGNNVVEIKDMYRDLSYPDWFKQDCRHKRVMVNGFFQHPKYYTEKEKIRSYFEFPKQTNENLFKDSIVMHVRLGDYFNPHSRSVIAPSWYRAVLDKIGYNPKMHKLYIVSQPPVTYSIEGKEFLKRSMEYLNSFKDLRTHRFSVDIAADFNFIRRFGTIICSNSTFCWWAAYLSKASRIFTFDPWIRDPHGKKIMLAHTPGFTPVSGKWLD